MSLAFRPIKNNSRSAKSFVVRRGISFALQIAALATAVTWLVVQLSARAIEIEQQHAFGIDITIISCLFAAIVGGVSFVYINSAMRGFDGIHGLLEKMRQGNYYARTEQVGCSQMRHTIGHFHEALNQMTATDADERKGFVEMAIALSSILEDNGNNASGHSQRVAIYAVEIGEYLGFDCERMEALRVGALLHDIGSMVVLDRSSLQNGDFDSKEQLMAAQSHSFVGDRILASLPGMKDVADVVRSHQERWDGRGYPRGLSGDFIPLEGRIVAIADAYDSMISNPKYAEAMPMERALCAIENAGGSSFDPSLTKVFAKMKRSGYGHSAPRTKKVDHKPLQRETMGS
ncbi:MAG: putative nucleotidyltransferase with HDIG domain [Myxococcota bacterium]|jgi:putative nucleotidyltransferase with HDIG domain